MWVACMHALPIGFKPQERLLHSFPNHKQWRHTQAIATLPSLIATSNRPAKNMDYKSLPPHPHIHTHVNNTHACNTHTHTHMLTHTHTHTHTHIHTQANKLNIPFYSWEILHARASDLISELTGA